MKRQSLKYILAALVALITLLVYLPALQNEFVNWDDTDLVIKNEQIRSINLSFIQWAFALHNITSANWHPLTWISHALDYAIWGLNPLGHHLTSIILHAVNTFLVVVLVTRLLELASPESPVPGPHSPFTPHDSLPSGKSGTLPNDLGKRPYFPSSNSPFTSHVSRFTLIAAGVTGLLFGLHPLHVEPVAWVSARADLLCALFYLLSIMAYIKYATAAEGMAQSVKKKGVFAFPPRALRYALGFFILALLSKPMAVSLPVVLLILDWYPLGRITSFTTFRASFIGKSPFIVLGLIGSTVAALARSSAGSIFEDTPLSTRILVSFKGLVAYLWKMILPFNLSSFYPYPENASLFSVEFGSAVALVIVISVTCMVMAKKKKIWLAAWGYYVITLLPVIGLIRLGIPAMADRYTYLPSLGPFLITGLLLARVSSRVSESKRTDLMVKLSGTVILVIMSFLTVKQIGVWKNGFALWSNVIEKSSEGYLPYLNRGELYFRSGQLDEALADFDKAIATIPSFYKIYNKLGVAYGKDDSFDKAIECFDKALAINPNDDEAYYYRGYTYFFINQHDKALEDYRKAIELNQGNAKAYVQRGNLYIKTGRKGLAIPDFQKACALGDEEGCKALQSP